MKKTILSFVIITLLFNINMFSQEKYNLDTETLTSIQKIYGNQNFKIYPVVQKEVEYYPYVSGEVRTKAYESLLEQMNKYRSEYEKYQNDKTKDSIYRLDIQNIITNIDKYLTSNEKSDAKNNYLIAAQNIADKNNIIIKGENTSLFARQLNNQGIVSNEDKTFVLYNGKKVSSKKNIEFYKSEIQKIKIPSVSISYDAKRYLQLLDEEKTITKTEIGQVRSKTKSKKMTYFITETQLDASSLMGNLEKLPNEYYLVTENVANKYEKNELTTDDKRYNENYKTDRFPIVNKIGTNEMYYIMSDQFLFQIGKEAEKKRYLNMASSAEYKTWKSKYLGLITSAQTNVSSCKSIIAKHTYKNAFGEKLYDSTTFSIQEKSTFNKNLDALETKLQQIRELERNKELYNYYNDKASIEDSAKSYHLSSFYNETNRAF